MSNKVFIYNGPGHFAQSGHDLKSLFENGYIFDRVDVVYTDFHGNFDGLNANVDNLTLVFPGGNAFQMYYHVGKYAGKFSNLWESGWNYVGVCAGGYLASYEAEFFQTAYQLDMAAYVNGFSPPVLSGGLPTLAVCDDYNALGPFYPDNAEYLLRIYSGELEERKSDVSSPMTRKPYCVDLDFHNGQRLPALYVDGCAFEKRIEAQSSHEVFASYPNRYTFLNRAQRSYKNFDSMPAIIYQKAPRGCSRRRGAVVASGVHFETCVADSQVLNIFCEPPNSSVFALSSTGQAALKKTRSAAEHAYSALLKDALTCS